MDGLRELCLEELTIDYFLEFGTSVVLICLISPLPDSFKVEARLIVLFVVGFSIGDALRFIVFDFFKTAV